MLTRNVFASLLAGAVLVAVAAGPAVAGGGSRTHDGFFLRMSAGLGRANADISDNSGSLEISGTAGDLNLAVGGMVGPNFALHGTLWGWSMSDPDGDLTVTGVGSGSGTLNGTLTMGAIGVGATYYFMPANVFASYSVGMGSLKGDGEDLEGKTKSGIAFDVTVGKEWWVGDAWGLGLNGGVAYFNAEDDTILGISESWTGPSYAVRFSATFN